VFVGTPRHAKLRCLFPRARIFRSQRLPDHFNFFPVPGFDAFRISMPVSSPFPSSVRRAPAAEFPPLFLLPRGPESPLLVSSAIPFRLISLAKPNGKLAGTRARFTPRSLENAPALFRRGAPSWPYPALRVRAGLNMTNSSAFAFFFARSISRSLRTRMRFPFC